MKVGDLVRLHQYPKEGFGIIISTTPRGARVCWDDGETASIWKIHLEVVNASGRSCKNSNRNSEL